MIKWAWFIGSLSAVCARLPARLICGRKMNANLLCCLARISARRPLLLIYLILIIFSTHLSSAEWVTGWCGEHHRLSLAERTMSAARERDALKMRAAINPRLIISSAMWVYVYEWSTLNKNEWTVSVVWHPWLDHEITWTTCITLQENLVISIFFAHVIIGVWLLKLAIF